METSTTQEQQDKAQEATKQVAAFFDALGQFGWLDRLDDPGRDK